ncbi:MAG TPA: ABC transporter substrate-binding protein [Usitatibacteraceae bacterium]|nr:ABC transporter substrate-binding protein [Usitatibacteraceae bacterium]
MLRRLLFLAACCLLPAAQAQNLVLGTKLELNTLDPHFFAAFPTGSSHEYLYDKLSVLDEKLRVTPSLAQSWKLVDDLTWEFRLRKGVVFHDGSPFTADDVMFTIERVPNVPNSPNSFSQFTRGIERVTKVDDHTIVIRTKAPNPMLPNDLANVWIISATAAKGASTADFNSGKAAIGTGPYRLVEWVNGERLVVERNERYWGPKPHWARVTERVIAKDPTRLAAFLSGEVDAIDAVPIQDLERLRKDGRFALYRGPAALVHYVALDSARDVSPFVTAKDGKPLGTNPLKDRRVRKALSLAINRDLIVRRMMEGSAIAASQLLSAEFPGSSKSLRPDPHDPAKAMALLKEAGWGEGFRIVLHATSERYPNDASVAQAIAQMWSRAGLKAEVETMPGSVFFSRASKQEFSAFAAQYGAEEAANSLRALVASYNPAKGFGTANRTRYSNPIVDSLLTESNQSMDDEVRGEKLARAINFAMADQPLIPVFYPIFDFAAKKDLAITPRAQRRFNAMMVAPRAK